MPDESGLIRDVDAITPSFIDSVDPNLLDTLTEISEAGLDLLVNAGALDSIPIIKTLIGVTKTAMSVHEANLMRQTATFLKALLTGGLDDREWEEHIRKLRDDPKMAAKEVSFVLALVDRNVDTTRSEMHGRLYGALISRSISWDEFVDMSEVASRCMVSDLAMLQQIRSGEIDASNPGNGFRADRLASLGLIVSGSV